MKKHFNLQKKDCYVIAEAGLNHNGSLDIAKRLIDVAVIAGADAVKFQKRTVDKLAVKSVLDAEDNRFPEFGKTYREIREHLEFNMDEYAILKSYCEERGLDFLCTAFDKDAVDFLEKLNIKAYKLASHSLTNLSLIEYVSNTGKPTILSTGMSELEEIDRAVNIFQKAGTPLMLLHCVSAYPTPPNQCNLSMISVLTRRYGIPVGYSGHEIGTLPTLASVARGASIVERHITLDRTMQGFDHKLSLEPDELIRMVRDIRTISLTIGEGEKSVSEEEMITRRKYHVSMVSSCIISEGTILTRDMIIYKNPGTGIPPKDEQKLLGKKAVWDVTADVLLEYDMFD